MVKKEMDNMLTQIKNIDDLNLESYLKNQYLDKDNKTTGVNNDINLVEKKELILNNTIKITSKSEDGKNTKKSQKEENDTKKEEESKTKPKRSLQSEGNHNNILFQDWNKYEDNKKVIVRNSAGIQKLKNILINAYQII